MVSPSEDPITRGTLFGGSVPFAQPADGYRAPVDGLLLARFAEPAGVTHAVDLGAGAGVVSLCLLARSDVARVLAVERDPVLSQLLAANLAANEFAARATVLHSDVEAAAASWRGWARLVVASPPFHSEQAATAARHPRARESRVARATSSPASPFLRAARTLLARGGRACFIWPAGDLEAFVSAAASTGLHPKRARFVHALPDREAHRVLVELKPGRPGGLVIAPPLVLAERPGIPTPECAQITT